MNVQQAYNVWADNYDTVINKKPKNTEGSPNWYNFKGYI